MARKRWERKDGKFSVKAVGGIKRVSTAKPRAIQSKSPPPNHAQHFTQGQIRTSNTSRLPYDGALSGSGESTKDDMGCIVPLDSTIYVSIFDPLGEAAFKPSPTKPIPTWMQWLPNQRGRSQNGPQPHSVLDEYFPPGSMSRSQTVCPTDSTPVPPFIRHPTPPGGELGSFADTTINPLKGPSFIVDEPLMRPSSRIAQSLATSPKTAIQEPSISPIPGESLPPRIRSPYSPRRPSPLTIHEEKPDDNNNSNRKEISWKARLHRRPSSPLAEQVTAHLHRYVNRTRTPPAQSKEFLNIYGSKQILNPGPSTAVPGRKLGRVVGDGRPVRDALSRDRTPSPLGGAIVASTPGMEGTGQTVVGTGEVVDLRTVRKRSSLQSEIKKLLSGRARE
ncbi:uncharacterized protein F4822DRAFT_19969 [Hypoxylon trugodes]|uniref:uncharacterized protein n=1 Tax=Hypoxylon trugodes TaxID=326681 RepID=UPI0021A04FB2|nr:uncharacterized protein F4822DRAFT_19969 [Hypoxylon trugodes]KAI1393649.1 hypothetical protein F4822DRAFT_19969 [Hypoxylon trugodes]